MSKTVVLDGSANLDFIIDGDISLQLDGAAECGIITRVHDHVPAYHGEITVTPGEETIVLSTQGKMLADDVTVKAIPRNYGLISWDGKKLRVS